MVDAAFVDAKTLSDSLRSKLRHPLLSLVRHRQNSRRGRRRPVIRPGARQIHRQRVDRQRRRIPGHLDECVIAVVGREP